MSASLQSPEQKLPATPEEYRTFRVHRNEVEANVRATLKAINRITRGRPNAPVWIKREGAIDYARVA